MSASSSCETRTVRLNGWEVISAPATLVLTLTGPLLGLIFSPDGNAGFFRWLLVTVAGVLIGTVALIIKQWKLLMRTKRQLPRTLWHWAARGFKMSGHFVVIIGTITIFVLFAQYVIVKSIIG